MVDPNSAKFITSLVKSLQMLCHGYMEFDNNIEIIGHINVRIDNSQKFDYIVNEQVSKQGGESTFFQSNSYHSLPPSKSGNGRTAGAGEQHQGRFDDDTPTSTPNASVNNHHRLGEDSVSRIQVDLSGPVPVTRSTSAPSPDGFFNTTGGVRRHSHSRDSRLHSLEGEQAALVALTASAASSSHPQDHSFNHSSLSSKDREEMELSGNGEEDRTEVLAMYKDSADRPRLHVSQRQDVIIKNEPNDHGDMAMEETGTRDGEVLDASSTSSMLPAAHQSALAAHAGHTMLTTATLGHPGFFDASMAQQDVSEVHHSDGSYRPVAMGDERDTSGRDLSKQCPQNGEAMSLVTRNRTPPDLGYPTGPTQLPQTADVPLSGIKDITQSAEKNRCDHCSKNFRNAQLLEMHIALIHTHRNYMSPKSMRTNSYLPSMSMSPSQGGGGGNSGRRASQSPSHQSTSSSSSRSKSQSPISIMSHSQAQPLALTHSLSSMAASAGGGGGSPSAASLGMSLPNLPNTMSSSANSSSSNAAAAAAAMTAAAMAQSYGMDQSQCGPMMGCQGASAFQCHLCHMPFVSWGLLAAHQNHCPRRGPHRCEQCGKAFRSKTSLTDHINTIHRGMLFICKGCRETFKWRTHIYQHKRKCPALQNATFESGSFFIEEMAQHAQHPQHPHETPPPAVPPPPIVAPVSAEGGGGEILDDSDRVN